MFDLFRFIMLRPPVMPQDSGVVTLGHPDSGLLRRLKEARSKDDPRGPMKEHAEAFKTSSTFLANPANVKNRKALDALIDLLTVSNVNDGAALSDMVQKAFDKLPNQLLVEGAFQHDWPNLHDSLLAYRVLAPAVPPEQAFLSRDLRLLALIKRLAAGEASVDVAEALARPIVLPAELLPWPLPAPPPAEPATGGPTEPTPGIEAAVRELSKLDAAEFAASSLTLRSFAGLTPATQALLADLEPGATAKPLRETIRSLQVRLAPGELENHARLGQPIRYVGGRNILADKVFDFPLRPNPNWPIVWPTIPSTRGSVRPIGIGDLLVVKYQLLRYERGEIAFVENILNGETWQRSSRRSETVEQTTLTETETTKEEERDLQSTDRFELQNETTNTLAAEGALKPGNAFSPSYGPVLEFQGDTDSPTVGSQQQSERQASTFSREVTSRSASRVSERIRRQTTMRVLREFRETTDHKFDNTGGEGHVTGIYQWLEKVLLGQVFNYGKRLMFDVMVPEPAAFYLFAQMLDLDVQGLEKPEPFLLGPLDVTEDNYSNLARQYGAAGLEPPPPKSVTVSSTISGNEAQKVSDKEISIPEGYQAISLTRFAASTTPANDDFWSLTVVIGGVSAMTSPIANPSLPLDIANVTSKLPFSVFAYHISSYVLSLAVECQRTLRTYQSWQTRTHAAILQAYQRQLTQFEERLANRQAVRSLKSVASPAGRRQTIAEELKRCCISIFTAQDFDIFNGIAINRNGYPQINFPKAESQGAYIRFFEQAFEWEQMIYLFYPYFWGRKAQWPTKMPLEDSDPKFAEFLRAGEARVTLPVRPGFEAAVAYFLETGRIWEGGGPPALTSPHYLPILDEIRRRDGAPQRETAQGETWELRLPTKLVELRPGRDLPQWQEKDGDWVEVPPP